MSNYGILLNATQPFIDPATSTALAALAARVATGTPGSAGGAPVLDANGNLSADIKKLNGNDLSLDASHRFNVTAVSVSDKTGYALTSTYDSAKSALTTLGSNAPSNWLNAASIANDSISKIQDNLGTLDNQTSILNAITNLNNLSALMNIFGSPSMEIPDSGSTIYAFTIVNHDNEGKLKDLDSVPTLTAINSAGTSRAGNLSAVTRTAEGRYTFTYTVDDDAVQENLRIQASGSISSEGRYVEWNGSVVDYEHISLLTAINDKTKNLPSNPSATGDAMTLTSDYNAAKSAASQSSVNSLNNLSASDVWNYSNRTLTSLGTLALDIWNTLDSALTLTGSIGFRLVNFITGNVFARLGAPVGASISADIANINSTGSGAVAITQKVTDGSNNLQNVTVRYTLNSETYTAITDSNGNAVFSRDPGSYVCTVSLSGFQAAPVSVTVPNAASFTADTIIMSKNSISIPANPDQINLVTYTRTDNGDIQSSQTVYYRLLIGLATNPTSYAYSDELTVVSDANGQAVIPWIPGNRIRWWRKKSNAKEYTVPLDAVNGHELPSN